MANLSKIKRERMLEYLEKLKAQNNDDENIRAITEIENALNEKRYGLVWEEHSEQVDEMLEHNIPVFTEVENRKIVADEEQQFNFLLEGDNLHSLKLLEKTHKGKIDVIYIDPPYNTGNKSWKYNNDYVEKDDDFKHSKFISFMYERLVIAKSLLTNEGIIICAIDDYEVSSVRLIMDELFGEANRLGTVVVVHNPRGRNDATFIAPMHEYMFFYAKDFNSAELFDFPLSEEDRAKYNKEDDISPYNETSFIRTGNNSLRTERPGLWYEIFYNIQEDSLSLSKTSENDVLMLPINSKNEERCWRWGPETFLKLKDTELFVKKVKGEFKIYKKRRLTEELGKRPKSVWADSKYDASSNGIMLLKKIFGGETSFPYPKSIFTVLDALKISVKKENAIVLDFFAGSGTTGHAVAQLNKEDGGNRKYILCTNNENNICEEVTYQRLKNIQDDLPHNLKYYKTDFIEKFSQEESISDKMLSHIRELIELEHHLEIDDKHTIILENEDDIENAISRIEDGGKLFIVSGIFLSRSDQKILEEKRVEMIEIPEYYFREELREVGEL